MHWIFLAALVGVTVVGVSFGEHERKSYFGYQVLDIIPKNREQVKFLRNLMTKDDNLDFWSEPTEANKLVTIMASPQQARTLQVLLRKEGIGFDTTVENMQSLLDPMWKDIDRRKSAKGGMVFDIDDFNTIEDINAWLVTLAGQCRAGLTCEVYSIGNTALGAPINAFKISRPDAGADRKGYWIDSAIHAREWIAPATNIKILDNLARGVDNNGVRLADDYDWYFVPILNVDGYAYTFTNDRLWRKNRSENEGSICIGTDLNRNYDYKWGWEGVNSSPCSDIYPGPTPGSEPETQAVSNELVRLGPSLLGMVTLHSRGQMWMFPWGNTIDHEGITCERTDDWDELMRVADLTADAVQSTYGTSWARGTSCEVIYTTTGASTDYAKAVAGIKYAFVPELRGANFVIDKSQIPLSYNEIWAGIVAMVDAIAAAP